MQKDEAPFRFSYPVINIRTNELVRSEIYAVDMASRVKKAFIKMPFKAVADEKTIRQMTKDAEAAYKKEHETEANGVIVFDSHFFERQRSYANNLSSLRDSVPVLEELGVNYVVASREELKHEFVYYHELPAMDINRIIELVKESEAAIKPDIFTDQERTEIAQRSLGLSRTQMKNLFVGAAYQKTQGNDYIEDIERIKQHILQDAGLEIARPVDLDDIGGLEHLKDFLLSREKGRELDIRSKGILLAGPPGSGKSLSAKAAATVFRTTLVKLDMARFYSKHLGETEQQFHLALKTIDAISPCVVLIDEIEKYFGRTNGEHETTRRLLGMLLHWLQESKSDRFIVATCNEVDALPPELMRAGRWDRSFFIDLPNTSERAKIFEIHLKKHGIDTASLRLDSLVNSSEGYSGAEIEQSIIDARFLAHEQGREIDLSILSQTLKDITPMIEMRRDEIEKIRGLKDRGFYKANEDDGIVRMSSRRISLK